MERTCSTRRLRIDTSPPPDASVRRSQNSELTVTAPPAEAMTTSRPVSRSTVTCPPAVRMSAWATSTPTDTEPPLVESDRSPPRARPMEMSPPAETETAPSTTVCTVTALAGQGRGRARALQALARGGFPERVRRVFGFGVPLAQPPLAPSVPAPGRGHVDGAVALRREAADCGGQQRAAARGLPRLRGGGASGGGRGQFKAESVRSCRSHLQAGGRKQASLKRGRGVWNEMRVGRRCEPVKPRGVGCRGQGAARKGKGGLRLGRERGAP